MIQEKPEALLINMPAGYFRERKEEAFRRFYESMGTESNPDGIFGHWISQVPKHEVTEVYVCFKGKVQYKAIIVQFVKNGEPWPGAGVRNWIVTTGPVVKAPEDLIQKGFRGFRYTKKLF